jgi:hypothetical protein
VRPVGRSPQPSWPARFSRSRPPLAPRTECGRHDQLSACIRGRTMATDHAHRGRGTRRAAARHGEHHDGPAVHRRWYSEARPREPHACLGPPPCGRDADRRRRSSCEPGALGFGGSRSNGALLADVTMTLATRTSASTQHRWHDRRTFGRTLTFPSAFQRGTDAWCASAIRRGPAP